MQEVTLNNKKYLLIEVPEYSSDFEIDNNYLSFKMPSDGFGYDSFECIKLDCTNLETVGLISDIIGDEYLCKTLVEENKQFLYKNYMSDNDKAGFNNATESFKSWVEAINLDLTKEYLLINKL